MSKLKLDERKGIEFIQELEELGYLQKDPDHFERYKLYGLTIKGRSLGMAKVGTSMNRVKADKLFIEFMERVAEVNNNPSYLYKISKVLLFGSYIKQAEILNDIDIAIELNPKESDKDKHNKLREKKTKESDKFFQSTLDELCWPETEVWSFLKSRSKFISLHPMEDTILDQTEVKQVYPTLS